MAVTLKVSNEDAQAIAEILEAAANMEKTANGYDLLKNRLRMHNPNKVLRIAHAVGTAVLAETRSRK